MRLSRVAQAKIKTRLRRDGLVILRMVNSGERFEFVSKKYVTIAPRYTYEKKCGKRKFDVDKMLKTLRT